MKVCRRCEQSKNGSDFAKSKATKDGLSTYCKKCGHYLIELYKKNPNAYRREIRALRSIYDDRRFWSFVDRQSSGGCWVWTGTIRNGYGRIHIGAKHFTAHRLSYQKTVGDIPSGMTLDHLCRNRSCVNPAHLEVTDMRTNVLRGFGPTAQNHRKTRCKRGHILSGDNVYYSNNGTGRSCRKCIVLRRNKEENRIKKRKSDKKWRETYPERKRECDRKYREKKKLEELTV